MYRCFLVGVRLTRTSLEGVVLYERESVRKKEQTEWNETSTGGEVLLVYTGVDFGRRSK